MPSCCLPFPAPPITRRSGKVRGANQQAEVAQVHDASDAKKSATPALSGHGSGYGPGPDQVSPEGITVLLQQSAEGDRRAFQRLIPLVYNDLRGIAHRRLKSERAGHTLNTTALVHEAWMHLAPQATTTWQDRAHFFAVAARVIRHVLVDYARRRGAEKRGGARLRVPLAEDVAKTDQGTVDLLSLDEALEALGRKDSRLRDVVECRFFGGMTITETAEALGVSCRTVERDWRRARTYLYKALAG